MVICRLPPSQTSKVAAAKKVRYKAPFAVSLVNFTYLTNSRSKILTSNYVPDNSNTSDAKVIIRGWLVNSELECSKINKYLKSNIRRPSYIFDNSLTCWITSGAPSNVIKVIDLRRTRKIYQFGLAHTKHGPALPKDQSYSSWFAKGQTSHLDSAVVVNFTICVATPLFGNRHKALDIITFIEINRVLG